jgi:hypothetical protein
MNEGYVYILTNSSFQDDYLKIGMTTKTPEDRAKQLSSTTSLPTTFVVAYSHKFEDCNQAERKIHDKLSQYRVNDDREFFQCNLDTAIRAFYELIIEDNKNEIENLKSQMNKTDFENRLTDKKLIKYSWDIYFERLGWNFSRTNNISGLKQQPDFILHTKDWNDEPDENFEKEIISILEKSSYVYIQENLPNNSTDIGKKESVRNIVNGFKEINVNARLFLFGASPLKNDSDIKLGWQSSPIHDTWDLITFVQHYDNSVPDFGILDDERLYLSAV